MLRLPAECLTISLTAALFVAIGPVESRADDKIGVEACDTFLTKYEICVATKVPAAQQQQLKTTLDQMRQGWKPLAANPQTIAGLEATCVQMAQVMKQQTAAYGCAW